MPWAVGTGENFEIPENVNRVKTKHFFNMPLNLHYVLATVPGSEDME